MSERVYPQINQSFDYDVIDTENESQQTMRHTRLPQVPPVLLQQNSQYMPVQRSGHTVEYHQKRVKCCSNCIRYWAYLLIFSGVLTGLCNFFFLFVMNSFSKIQWVDGDGKMQTIHIDPSFLFLMAVSKIIMGGFLVYKQGKATLKVVNPILKEYREAEAGITQGIPMNENKSCQLQALKKTIWRLTLAMIFIFFVTLLIVKSYAQTKVAEYINAQFTNSSDVESFSVNLGETFNHKNLNFLFQFSDSVENEWTEFPHPIKVQHDVLYPS